MRGVIYARYSEGPRQTDQSIEGQVADCTAFAKKNGIEIIEIYADRHISGKSVDRRLEFQSVLASMIGNRFAGGSCQGIGWRFSGKRKMGKPGKIRSRKILPGLDSVVK